MSYQSLGFIVFSAFVVLLYYLVGRKLQLWVLALANLSFYLFAGIEYLPFILVTMLTTFFAGKRMGKIYAKADEKLALCQTPAEKKTVRADAKKDAKRALIAGIVVTLALLVVCKYTSFLLENVNSVLSLVSLPKIEMFKMILPLGISFYSFMALSYILDVYWKRYKAENNFLMYAVYLSYFPHVVQGPIDRFNEFKEQVKEGVKVSYKNITYGAQLSLWGFFKKLVIADRIGMFVDSVMNSWDSSSGLLLIITMAVYSIQIYCDFSGCIDIVTGVSEMMGIKLRKNFNHPYFSKTMPEFWRRWHISLQEWFKDYIYFPVSASNFTRNVKKKYKEKNNLRGMELFSSCFPVCVVWLITGIWHGAAWKFVAWGLFHMMLLVFSQIFEPTSKKINSALKINPKNFIWCFFQMVRTFTLCCIGRVFFRADNLAVSVGVFKRMICNFACASNVDFGIDKINVLLSAVAIFVLLIIDILQEKMSLRETLSKRNIVLRWVLIFGLLFSVIIFGIYGPGYNASSFIYEQF